MLFSTVSAADMESISSGKGVVFNSKTGNCLACHMIDDGESAGDIGPPLIAMKTRFPDREKLRDQINNPTTNNPNTRMPPFGKYRILSSKDIDAIVDYLYTL